MKPTSNGRVAYTVVEDKAIMDYVKKHSKENGQFSIKGNALYRNMERDKVTKHPWQSMKCRYLKLLADTNVRFEFRQMIQANAKGKDITVLTQPVRSSNLDAKDIRKCKKKGSWRQDLRNSAKPHGTLCKEMTVDSKSDYFISYLKSAEGKAKLRSILIEERVKEFMMRNSLCLEEAIEILHSFNGNLKEAENSKIAVQ